MSTATASPRAAFDAALLERIIASSSLPSWASDVRRAAFDRFVSLGLPDRRDENWMRTDVRLFKPQAWGPSAAPASVTVPEGLLAPAILSGDLAADSYADFDRAQAPFVSQHASAGSAAAPAPGGKLAGRLASVDGHVVRHELDPVLAAKGVVFGPADELLASHTDALRPHWFRVIDTGCDWFAAAHAAFHTASTVLYVPPGVRIADPLHVIAGMSDGGVDTSHVLEVQGEGAEAALARLPGLRPEQSLGRTGASPVGRERRLMLSDCAARLRAPRSRATGPGGRRVPCGTDRRARRHAGAWSGW